MIPMDLTPEQWRLLAQGPAMAAVLMMRSHRSNPVSSAVEDLAAVEAFREGLLDARTPVMQALQNEYENLGVDTIRKLMTLNSGGDDLEALRSKALADLRANMDLVRAIGGREDGEQYAKFVMHVAGKVANAARDGGFLGIGGQEISEREQAILDQLRNTLGV